MSRILLLLVPLALAVYALLDCARTDQDQIRNLPKWGWLIIIIVFQLLGPIAWLIAGKPRGPRGTKGSRRKILPPDDNPDFLGSL